MTQLLTMVSEALSKKVDPLHAVLQTRFNLYGTPFERELFDTDPPLLTKQTVSDSLLSLTYNNFLYMVNVKWGRNDTH